jgi:hypothetical protein
LINRLSLVYFYILIKLAIAAILVANQV